MSPRVWPSFLMNGDPGDRRQGRGHRRGRGVPHLFPHAEHRDPLNAASRLGFQKIGTRSGIIIRVSGVRVPPPLPMRTASPKGARGRRMQLEERTAPDLRSGWLALASFRLESSPSSAIQVDREFNGSSRSLYAVISDGLRAAMPRWLALASFRLESSPSSAIQVDRESSGGSRAVYAVMSDGLRVLVLAAFRILHRSHDFGSRASPLRCAGIRSHAPTPLGAVAFTSMARFECCATILDRRPTCDTLTSSI